MNIKTSSLKAFQKLAGNIEGTTILPVTDYLKFEPGKITKTALSSFIQFDCEGIDETLLVDEKQLFNLLGVTSSEYINISGKGNKTTISDTRDKLSFQVQPVEHFPVTPTPVGDNIELSADFAQALYMASFFPLAAEQIPTTKSFCHVGNKTICASDGFIAFRYPIEENVKMVLDKSTATMIAKIKPTAFGQADNYYFFFSPGITIGFSTQEIGYSDLNMYFDINGKKVSFSAVSSDLSSFNSLAMKSADNALVNMSKGVIKMENNLFDIQLERPMENLDVSQEWRYNPGQMNRLLTAIECTEVDFYEGDRMYYIKSQDYKFTTLIMKIAKPVIA